MSTTTHAQETPPQDEAHDHGAPQAGGFSGVAAPPGEGAREREAVTAARDFVLREIRAHFQLRGCIGETRGRYLVRRIDAALAAPAPSSPRAEAPEAEPADAAALLEAAQGSANAALVTAARAIVDAVPWTTKEGRADYSTMVGSDKIAALRVALAAGELVTIAALRRAAPGAAHVPAGDGDAPWAEELLLTHIEATTPVGEKRLALIEALMSLTATPAPTGERAGGKARGRAAELVPALRWCARQLADVDWAGGSCGAQSIDDAADVLESLTHPAPVAAPRGTEGRDDA